MDEHELLIRHAVAWAEKRRQPLDRDLLETVVRLRDLHDASLPQEWPPGSAEHLMLVRWPSHGPSGVPDVEALVTTLDSFWRFLRGTGRMASASADPRALVKEARRAAPQMPAACQDPARRSASKTLMEFGESIGLTLDGLDSIEDANARLQQITQAWNDLPDDERMAMLPGPAHQGSVRGVSVSEYLASMSEEDDGEEDDDLFGLADEDGTVPFADLAAVAADVRDAPYLTQCRRLVEWVGTGREVTSKGVLRLAPAREAYDVLGLGAWDRAEERLTAGRDLPDLTPEAEELWNATARDSFRSAADCRVLDRLWLPCLEVGVLELSRTRAYGDWDEPTSDEEWRRRGVALVLSHLVHLPSVHVAAVLGALMHLLVLDPARGSVPLRELEDWWWQSPRNIYPRLGQEEALSREWSDRALHRALHEMDDTRVWRRAGEELFPTALGHDIALMAAALVEQGAIEE